MDYDKMMQQMFKYNVRHFTQIPKNIFNVMIQTHMY